MKRAALFFLCTLISACSISPVTLPTGGKQLWQERQRLLSRLDTWALTGRVALTTEDEGWNATLQWKQHADGYDIRIIAPFGQGTVSLRGNAEGVILRSTRDPRPMFAPNAEALLYSRLGWRVPVEGLRYWVLGLPDPARRYTLSLDAHGRLAHLQQSGWDIRFVRYGEVKNYQLPEKIFMESKDMQVRMVIQRWQLAG